MPDGRLLLPLTVRGNQLSIAFTHTGPGLLTSTSVRSCAFSSGAPGAERRPGRDTVLPVAAGRCSRPAGFAMAGGTPAWTLLERALHEGRRDRNAPVPGSVSDLWDGLRRGARSRTRVVRLLGPDDGCL
ncbi:hypothetical protein HBB16_17120 [Pseudonocardia sp. MCCB 268]|nr:hypothetical protein [Pseudonocardia cytotoxica]